MQIGSVCVCDYVCLSGCPCDYVRLCLSVCVSGNVCSRVPDCSSLVIKRAHGYIPFLVRCEMGKSLNDLRELRS